MTVHCGTLHKFYQEIIFRRKVVSRLVNATSGIAQRFSLWKGALSCIKYCSIENAWVFFHNLVTTSCWMKSMYIAAANLTLIGKSISHILCWSCVDPQSCLLITEALTTRIFYSEVFFSTCQGYREWRCFHQWRERSKDMFSGILQPLSLSFKGNLMFRYHLVT